MIDVNKKQITNIIPKESTQYDHITKILLEGYSQVPAGFRKTGDKSGYGLAGQGYRILSDLSEIFGKHKYDLIISKNDGSTIKTLKSKYKVIFNEKDFFKILGHLNKISREKGQEIKVTCKSYLNYLFPTHFSPPLKKVNLEAQYKKGDLSKVLNKDGILTGLSKEDKEGIEKFYFDYLRSSTSKLNTSRSLLQLTDSKNQTQVVLLENILKEFDKKILEDPTEQKWQDFLKEYILFINLNYTEVVDKKNIGLIRDKIPDFMLLDIYNYLDVYEIKRPSTKILEFDEDHNDFYWSADISKAVAQLENYIQTTTEVGPEIKMYLEKYYDLNVRVIKPRGYIIAGTSDQLKTEYYSKRRIKPEKFKTLTNVFISDNFRILNQSMKNIEVLFYDELINNLRTLLKRLKK